MSGSIFSQDYREQPYWWDAAEPAPTPTDLPARTAVAIVGGGYTGLNAAITLRRLGHEVIVLDAERIGWGASSRSGGMVSGGLRTKVDHLPALFGAERAAAMVASFVQAFPYLEQAIAGEGIDCDYVRCGRFIAAWTPQHYASLDASARQLAARTGMPVRMVTRAAQRSALGTDVYHGGMIADATGSLQPAKLARGFAREAQAAGAGLVDRARVTSIRRDGAGFRLSTSRGELRADAVLVATNGYSRLPDGTKALPYLAHRMVPVASHIIATEELPDGLMDKLFPGRRMVGETKRVMNYYRPSPDGKRIVWGGRASFVSGSSRDAATTLHGRMLRVFPELAGVKVSHSWQGNVSFSFDGLPHIGVLDGVHYAGGCQGNGVAMMSWLGHNAALKLAGVADERFAFDLEHFPTRPLYNGNPAWVLPWIGNYYRLRDWMERPG